MARSISDKFAMPTYPMRGFCVVDTLLGSFGCASTPLLPAVACPRTPRAAIDVFKTRRVW